VEISGGSKKRKSEKGECGKCRETKRRKEAVHPKKENT